MYKWASKELKTPRYYKVGRYSILLVETYFVETYFNEVGFSLDIGCIDGFYFHSGKSPSRNARRAKQLNMKKFANSLAYLKLINKNHLVEIINHDKSIRLAGLDDLYRECLLLDQAKVL